MTRPYFKHCPNWEIITLEEDDKRGFIKKAGSGSTPPTGNIACWNGTIPWLTPKDIAGYRFRFVDSTERFITEAGLNQAGELWPSKTVMLTKRAPVGYVVMNSVPMATNQGFMNFVCDEKLLPEFLYYWLSLNTPYLDAVANGSTYPELYSDDLFEFEISVPSIAEQRSIVKVLSYIDDKIELNLRTNQTSEEILQLLFKSWFVDFDPVVAKADMRKPSNIKPELAELFPSSFIDTEIGSIPKGWKPALFSEGFDINPSRRLTKGAKAPYLDMASVPTDNAYPDEWVTRAFSSGLKFMNGDTIVARITPCLENGKTAFINFLNDNEIGWGSTEYIVIRSRPPLPLEYSYFFARSDDFRSHAIANMTGSSGRQRVPESCFDHFLVVMPPENLLKVFGAMAKESFVRMKMNQEQNKCLLDIKKLLLPQLISGRVHLKDAESVLEKVI